MSTESTTRAGGAAAAAAGGAPPAATERDMAVLASLIKDNKFCMLTTIDADGLLRSRPMGVQGELEKEGESWRLTFFTYKESAKVCEMGAHDRKVNLAFSNPATQKFVSISGKGECSQNRAEMEKRWSPAMRAWFPNGLDTPGCALLKVTLERAEYWDAPSSTVAHVVSFVKSQLTGKIGAGDTHKAVQVGGKDEGKEAAPHKKAEAKMEDVK